MIKFWFFRDNKSISKNCLAFCSPQIHKRYKRNNINGDLHQAFEIDSDFDAEVSIITKKFLDAGYPIDFIKSVISAFKMKDEN